MPDQNERGTQQQRKARLWRAENQKKRNADPDVPRRPGSDQGKIGNRQQIGSNRADRSGVSTDLFRFESLGKITGQLIEIARAQQEFHEREADHCLEAARNHREQADLYAEQMQSLKLLMEPEDVIPDQSGSGDDLPPT